MTEKELHKLHKTELLELLLAMRKELDRMKEENAQMQKKLETAEKQEKLLEKIWDAVDETASIVRQQNLKEAIDSSEQ